MKSPKRDFIFIDESGDTNTLTEYYIVGLIHINDVALENINVAMGGMRFFAHLGKELKSTSLNATHKSKLLDFHNEKCSFASNEIELIIDRFHSNKDAEKNLKNYLRSKSATSGVHFLHIIQADSRYVDCLQLADSVCDIIKHVFFKNKSNIFSENDLKNVQYKELK